jgi:hypothetical protein
MSSSTDHLPCRCYTSRTNAIWHCTDFSFDPEPARQLQPNSCHRAFVPHPSVCCLRLRTIDLNVLLPGQCFDIRNYAICYNTDVSFDPEPALKLQPNSRHRASVLHPSACCLRLLPTHSVHSPCREPRYCAIYSNTEFSFDPEPARQLRPNSCLRACVPHPSACCLHLLTI